MEENVVKDVEEESSITLKMLFHAIWKNIILVAIITVAIFVLGAFYTFGVKKPTYVSQAEIVVKVNVTNDTTEDSSVDVSTGLRLINTIAELATTDVVLDDVISTLELKDVSISDLQKEIKVTSSTSSFLIRIKAQTNSKEDSQLIANQVVSSLIKVSNTNEFDFLNGIIVSVSNAKIGTYASPNKVLYLFISLLIGIVVSLIVAFMKEFVFKTKLDSIESIKDNLKVEVIGTQLDEKELANISKNLPYTKVNVENYSKLMSNLDFSNVNGKLKTIAFTSTDSNDGKTSTIFNLAITMGHNDKKVLVLDLDLRNSSIHRYFGMDNQKGINDFMTNQATSDQIIKNYCENVDLITSGGKTPNPSLVLSSSSLEEFINKIKQDYDYLLIDCPPVFVYSDVKIISKYTDGIVYVVKNGETRISNAKQGILELQKIKANILGVDVTRLKKISRGSYYYNYKYDSK